MKQSVSVYQKHKYFCIHILINIYLKYLYLFKKLYLFYFKSINILLKVMRKNVI